MDWIRNLKIGTKLILGITVVTNILLGLLVLFLWMASYQTDKRVQDIFLLLDSFNSDLRSELMETQNRSLKIPEMLENDPSTKIVAWLKENYGFQKEETLEGRENYKSFYKRTQRRDLSKGRFTAGVENDQLVVSQGLMDENKEFTDKVRRMFFSTSDPDGDLTTVKNTIEEYSNQQVDAESIQLGINNVKQFIADEGIRTEEVRNRILYEIENIEARQNDLDSFKLNANLLSLFICLLVIIVNSIVLYLLSKKIIIKPILLIAQKMTSLGVGDLETQLDHHSNDEFGDLSNDFNKLVSNQKKLVALAGKISQGDLTVHIEQRSDRDALASSLQTMVKQLSFTVNEILQAASHVTTSSTEISMNSHALSQGAIEQASSLEQISSSINVVESQSRENAKGADGAKNLIENVKDIANRAAKQMEEMIDAMKGINEASGNISKIIKVIDEIAFQTNLLALNAAVEAARAGKYGKGFAVVAEEVRNLAGRSADAARETTELIEGTIAKTNNGATISEKTSTVLAEIVTAVDHVSNQIADISVSSKEQANSISQITAGLEQIEKVTQQAAAQAEEGASSSEELANQARMLEESIRVFKVNEAAEEEEEEETKEETPLIEFAEPVEEKFETFAKAN